MKIKNKTKLYICYSIVIFNFFLVLGYTASCEQGLITLENYITKLMAISITTMIPTLKSGAFKIKN